MNEPMKDEELGEFSKHFNQRKKMGILDEPTWRVDRLIATIDKLKKDKIKLNDGIKMYNKILMETQEKNVTLRQEIEILIGELKEARNQHEN